MPHTDPRAYLKILWRWKFLFLALVVVVPAIAYAVVSRQHKVFESSILLQETSLKVDTSLFGSNSAPAPATNASPQTLGGEARIIETPVLAQLAAKHLTAAPANPNELLTQIKAVPNTNTGFITVTARSSRPVRAAEIANAFGAAVVDLRNSQAVALLSTTISGVQAQLDHIPAKNKTAQTQLSGQLQQLRALRAAQSRDASVLQPALPNRTAVSPRTTRIVVLGLIAGLLLAFGAVFLAEAADRRIRHPDDLEDLTKAPLLAVIPRVAFSTRGHEDKPTDEAFHMLRSALMFFNVDRPVRSVLIASAIKDEGKTTVATRLAIAAAEAGRSVILVDADLRRPQAASRLGVEKDQDRLGLGALLAGQSSLGDALVEIPVAAEEDDDTGLEHLQGRLRLLPGGPPPPNPSELLASGAMRGLVEELEAICDLVVIDSNPLLSVSDSLPLFELVSVVILVARLAFTTKDAIRRFLKTVRNTSASIVGVVATGAAEGRGAYGYGYGYGYYGYTSTAYSNGNGGGRKLKWPGSRNNGHVPEKAQSTAAPPDQPEQ